MAKFCGKCGARLDEVTGLCPNCDADKMQKDSKKKSKSERRTQKKAAKREKRARWSTGKKIRRFFLKLILTVILLVVLAAGVTGALVYFDVVEIPSISYILERSGLGKRESVSINPLVDNYVPDENTIAYDEETNLFYANNEIIVIFSNDATDIQKEEVISYLDGELVGTIPELNMYQIMIPDCDTLQELLDIAEEVISKFDYVIYATYDTATVKQSDVYAPNDPWDGDVTKQDWEDGSVDGSNWWMEAIDVQSAWDYQDHFSEIVIGICDSSFDTGHEDLKNKVLFPNKILESRNVVAPWWNDFNNDTWSVSDQANYHGTHVAGIIGAEGDNKKGITGIVQNCRLLLAPYYRSDSMDVYLAWDSSTYANLSYLVKSGAKVINFSQGKTNFLSEKANHMAYDEKTIEREGNLASISIAQLINSGYKDFIVVQSAGNGTGDTGKALDAIQNGWFASITDNSITGYDNITTEEIRSHVIIVGAADRTSSGFQCASFSNYGSQVNICAPGVNIYSTVPGDVFYDFQLWGGCDYASGTSMSAPIVTGVCALIWSANPELLAEEVKDIICNSNHVKVSASPENLDNSSYNMVNAAKAVEAALNYIPENSEGNQSPYNIPSDAVELNGHYYYVYDIDTITDWTMAQEYCEAQGGYLATITGPEEDTFLYSYITDAGYSSVMFGLTDQEQTDDWRWVTGEGFSYQNWRSGEPNHQGGYEHYGIYYDRNTDGTWNDGSGRGGPFLCEWGEYTVASGNEPTQEPVRTTSDERDIVLVLDASGSMSGTPIEETKKASMNFIDTILEEDASIGIVTYDDNAEQLANFSVDKDHLTEIISALSDGGGTNIEAGLTEAQSMLDSSSAKKKIIVLMSDGEPNEGKEGEELIAYADQIKNDDILIYTLGFFENMGGNKSSAQYLMEQLASDGCHYEVANADDLVFFFEDMADQINGQKYIYIRIACPVDVSVTYNGETLNSAEENQVLRTDFGTLTFEDSEETSSNQAEEQIKVLRLKEGVDYNVKIVGTGRGIMDYTIGFMDENGDYSDFRRFEDIKITKETVIDTVATVSEESVLNIDEDGDGNYDLKLRADENGFGEEVKQVPWLYIVIGGIIFVLVVVLVVILKVCNKKRRAEIRAISKYCGNCGAKLENSEKVCRHCGRPVDSFLTTASGVIVVGSNRQKKVKRTVRLIAGLIVTVIIATLSVNIASNFTGYYSLLGKILNAYEDDDIDAFVSLSSNVYYYSNENWVENYFENSVGFSLDFFETAVGYRYNLSYEVNEIYVMSERNKDKLIKTLEEAYPEFNTSLIEDVVVADMTVTASQDKKSTSKNIEITMTKEDGEWKILYIE